jgi:hypothetical protein
MFFTPHKAVILSEALGRTIGITDSLCAESKDPGDACWQMCLPSFPATNYEPN